MLDGSVIVRVAPALSLVKSRESYTRTGASSRPISPEPRVKPTRAPLICTVAVVGVVRLTISREPWGYGPWWVAGMTTRVAVVEGPLGTATLALMLPIVPVPAT